MAYAPDSGAPPWPLTPTQHPPFEDLSSVEEHHRKSSPDFFSRGCFVLLIVCGLCSLPAKPPVLARFNVDGRVWELLRLLFVGVVVSYGVLGRRSAVVANHAAAMSQKITSFDGESGFKSWGSHQNHGGGTTTVVSEDDGVVIRSRRQQPLQPARSVKRGDDPEQQVIHKSEFLDYSRGFNNVLGNGSNGGNQVLFDGIGSEKMRNFDSKSEEILMRKEQLATYAQASPFLLVNSFAASLFSEEIYPSSLAPEINGIGSDLEKEKILLVENNNHQPQGVAKASSILSGEHTSKENKYQELEVKISEESILNTSDSLSESLRWIMGDENHSEGEIKAMPHGLSRDLLSGSSMISKSYNRSKNEISEVPSMVRSGWENEDLDGEFLDLESRLPQNKEEEIVRKIKDLGRKPRVAETKGRSNSKISDGKRSTAEFDSLAKHPEGVSGGSTVPTRSKKREEDTMMNDAKKNNEQETVMVKKRERKINAVESQHRKGKSSRGTNRSKSKKPMEEHGKKSIAKSKYYDAAAAFPSSIDDKDLKEATSSKLSMTGGLEENEVDKKAGEFIAKFRAQIRDQKAESIRKSNRRRMEKH